MGGLSVVSPAAPKPKLPRGAARDLYRMICALSGACERDSGVLRDGALVDTLELKAKQILRARRALSSSSSSVASHRLSTSPVLAPQAPAKISKRRKLPAHDYDKMDHTYGYDKSPLLAFDDADKASLYMSRGDGSAALIPSVKIGKIEPSSRHKTSPYAAAMSGDVIVNSVSVSSGSRATSPIQMEHLSLEKPVPARPSRQSLDLGASMASTVSSMSMQPYDMSDVEDRYSSVRSPYDYEHFTPIRSSVSRSGSYGEERPITPTTDLDDSFMSEYGTGRSRRKDSCYSEASTSSFGDRSTPKKLRFEMDALSLYEKETSSLKEVESGLVETLQSQVDLLLTENVKAMSENARLTELSQMSACEAEAQAAEKARIAEQVKEKMDLIADLEEKYLDTKQRADAQEGFRREAEVAFQSELDAKAQLVEALQKQMITKDEEIGRLSKRVEDISGLFATKMRDQDGQRVSLTRSSSVGQSSGSPAKLPSDAAEPELVTSLRESNLFMDMELERMRASLLEKDREICNLYMHLSTKKKLIDEITKKFVQHMEEAAAAAKATNTSMEVGASGFSPDGVRFDLDMFLFKNVVDKQRRMEELTAALGVMDREVETLESRVAEKERENKQLRENQEFLTRSLQTVNAEVCRIQAENETLVASVQEKETNIMSLVASLEEKDEKIHHLNEQVDLRHMQIDHLMSDEKSSGRRSLKSSLLKPFSSSSAKGASRLSLTSVRGGDDASSQRGSFSSSVARRSSSASVARKSLTGETSTTMRSSLDWTDAHRPSVVMALRSTQPARDFAKTKRSSVFSDVFKDISAPISDDEDSVFGASASDVRSTDANYCASEINDDEELYNELFAKA